MRHTILSIIGSAITTASYVRWSETLSVAALITTLASGILTAGYTIWRWNRDARKKS